MSNPRYYCNKCGFVGESGPMAWHLRPGTLTNCNYLAARLPEPVIPHTKESFVASFESLTGVKPTDQEIWDAAIRSWRDLNPPTKIRDGIADFIEVNTPHQEFWTPAVVELIRSIEVRQ